MVFQKCKKCGGKKISVTINKDIEIDGILRNVENIPAKKCAKCGDIVINSIILERINKFAHEYPDKNLDYEKCEEEESVASQLLF